MPSLLAALGYAALMLGGAPAAAHDHLRHNRQIVDSVEGEGEGEPITVVAESNEVPTVQLDDASFAQRGLLAVDSDAASFAGATTSLFESSSAWSGLQVFEQQSLYSLLLSFCSLGAAETTYSSAFLARLLTGLRNANDNGGNSRIPLLAFPQGVDNQMVYTALTSLLDIGHCTAIEGDDLTTRSAALTSPAPLRSWVLHALVRDAVSNEVGSEEADNDGRTPPDTASLERLAAVGDLIRRELLKARDGVTTNHGIKDKLAEFKAKWASFIELSTSAAQGGTNININVDSNKKQPSSPSFGGLQHGETTGTEETEVGKGLRFLAEAFVDIATDPSLFAIRAAFGHASGGLCTSHQPADPAQQTEAEKKRGEGLTFGCSEQAATSFSRLYAVSLFKQVYALAAKEVEDEWNAATVAPLQKEEEAATSAAMKAEANLKKEQERLRPGLVAAQQVASLKTQQHQLQLQKAGSQPHPQPLPQDEEVPLPVRRRTSKFILEDLDNGPIFKEFLGDNDNLEAEDGGLGGKDLILYFNDPAESIEKDEPPAPLLVAKDKLERAVELKRLRRLHVAQSFYLLQSVLQLHDDPCTLASLELPPALFAVVSDHAQREAEKQLAALGKNGGIGSGDSSKKSPTGTTNLFAPDSNGWIDKSADYALEQELKNLFDNGLHIRSAGNEAELAKKGLALGTSPDHELQNGNVNGQQAKAIVDSKKLNSPLTAMMQGQAAAAAPKALSSSTTVFVLFKRLGWAELVKGDDGSSSGSSGTTTIAVSKEPQEHQEILEITTTKQQEEEELDLIRGRRRTLHQEEDGPNGSGVSRVTLSPVYLNLVSKLRKTIRASLFNPAPTPFNPDPQSSGNSKAASSSSSDLWLPIPAEYQAAGHPALQPLLEPSYITLTPLGPSSKLFKPLVTSAQPLPDAAGKDGKVALPQAVADASLHLRDLASFILMLEVAWQFGPSLPDYEEIPRPPLDLVGAAQITYGQGLHAQTFSMSVSKLKKFSEGKKALGIFEMKAEKKWEERALDIGASFISYREETKPGLFSRSNNGPSPTPDPLKAKRSMALSSFGGVAIPVPQGRVALERHRHNELGRAEEKRPEIDSQPPPKSDPALDAASDMMQQGRLCATLLNFANLDASGQRGVSALAARRDGQHLGGYYKTVFSTDQFYNKATLDTNYLGHNAAVFAVLPDPSPLSRFFVFCTPDPMPMPRAPVPPAPRGQPQPVPGPVLHADPTVVAWIREQAKPLITQMCVAAHSLGLLHQLRLEQYFSWSVWATAEIPRLRDELRGYGVDHQQDLRYKSLLALKGTMLHEDVAAALRAAMPSGVLLNSEGRLDCNALILAAQTAGVARPNGDASFPLDLAASSMQRMNAGPALMGKLTAQLDSLARVVLRDSWAGNARLLLNKYFWSQGRKDLESARPRINIRDDAPYHETFHAEVNSRLLYDPVETAYSSAAYHGESPKREMALLRKRKHGATRFSRRAAKPPMDSQLYFGRHATMTRGGRALSTTISPVAKLMTILATTGWGASGARLTNYERNLLECTWPKEAMSSAKDSPLLGTSTAGGREEWLDYWWTDGDDASALTRPLPVSSIPVSCEPRLSLIDVQDPEANGNTWKPSFTNVWVSNKDRLVVVAFSHQRAKEELTISQPSNFLNMADLLDDTYGRGWNVLTRQRYPEHERVIELAMRKYGGTDNMQFVFVGYCFGGAAAISYSRKYNVPAFVINPAPIIQKGIVGRLVLGQFLAGIGFLINTATLTIPRRVANAVQRQAPNYGLIPWTRFVFPRRLGLSSFSEEMNDYLVNFKPPVGNGITHIWSIAGDWASAGYVRWAVPDYISPPPEAMLPKGTAPKTVVATPPIKPGGKPLAPFSTASSSSNNVGVAGSTGVLEPGSWLGNGYSITLFPCISRRSEVAAHTAYNLFLFPSTNDPWLDLLPGTSIEAKDLVPAATQLSARDQWLRSVGKSGSASTSTTSSLKGAPSNKQTALTKPGSAMPRFKWPATITFPETDATSAHSMNIGYGDVFNILHVYDRLIQAMPPVTSLTFPESRDEASSIRVALSEADIKREESRLEQIRKKASFGS